MRVLTARADSGLQRRAADYFPFSHRLLLLLLLLRSAKSIDGQRTATQLQAIVGTRSLGPRCRESRPCVVILRLYVAAAERIHGDVGRSPPCQYLSSRVVRHCRAPVSVPTSLLLLLLLPLSPMQRAVCRRPVSDDPVAFGSAFHWVACGESSLGLRTASRMNAGRWRIVGSISS